MTVDQCDQPPHVVAIRPSGHDGLYPALNHEPKSILVSVNIFAKYFATAERKVTNTPLLTYWLPVGSFLQFLFLRIECFH